MIHNPAPRWGLRRGTSLLAVSALVTLGLVGVPSLAVPEDECVPSDGSPAVFSAWTISDYTDWQHENTPPPDPDGQSGEDNPANLQMVGPAETRDVSNDDGSEGSWTEWTNAGDVIRTEANAAPGADTDTERYLFLGETDPEVITPETEGQHYSWTGGPIPEDEVPPVPPAGDWQANTSQEPHKNNPKVTWVAGTGLHFTGASGNANWFYFAAGAPAVTDIDYLWQKQVREWDSGDEETFHTEYRWQLLSRTFTPAEEPVECPSEGPVDDGDDGESPGPDDGPGPNGNQGPDQVQVAGAQAAVPATAQTQVPTSVAAGLGETASAQSDRVPLGLLLVMFGVLITAAAGIRRSEVVSRSG